MKKSLLLRVLMYIIGLLILALGIILNTKCGLGVSPIISISFCVSTIANFNFGNMTFLLYAAFVVIQIILHIISYIRNKQSNIVLLLTKDLLQLLLSLVFTRFMNLFSELIPTPTDNIPLQIFVLVLGIVFTGIGTAMSLNMRLIPNPGDGIVQSIADFISKPVGITKNCFDLFNICVSIVIGIVFAHTIIGIGIGTILSMLCVGRVIAIFNHFFMEKMTHIANIDNYKCSVD